MQEQELTVLAPEAPLLCPECSYPVAQCQCGFVQTWCRSAACKHPWLCATCESQPEAEVEATASEQQLPLFQGR